MMLHKFSCVQNSSLSYFFFLTSVDCKLFCANDHTGFLNLLIPSLPTMNNQAGDLIVVTMKTTLQGSRDVLDT